MRVRDRDRDRVRVRGEGRRVAQRDGEDLARHAAHEEVEAEQTAAAAPRRSRRTRKED